MKVYIEFNIDSPEYKLNDGSIDFESIQDRLIIISEDIADGNTGDVIKAFDGSDKATLIGQYVIGG